MLWFIIISMSSLEETTMRSDPAEVVLDQRALVVNESGQLFLIKTEAGWDLPGGLYDGNGNWRESLESMVEESSGLAVMTKQPVYAADFEDPEAGTYIYMNVIECLAIGETLEFDGDDSLGKWFNAGDLSSLEYAAFEVRQAVLDFMFVPA